MLASRATIPLVERHPAIAADEVAWISAEQMREVDRLMIAAYRIALIQMMENAGRNLARLVLAETDPGSAVVLAGGGGNGGGGLAAARHLANAGVAVTVVAPRPERMAEIPAWQMASVRAQGTTVLDEAPAGRPDVVVDALVGYSLRGAPRRPVADLVDWANAGPEPVVALDTPSGLDVTSGRSPGALVRAAATLTLALPKTGLRHRPEVGRLYLADISVPPALYAGLGIGPVPSFRSGTILSVEDR